MPSSPRRLGWTLTALTAATVALGQATLPERFQIVEAGGALLDVFFEPAPTPAGAVDFAADPAETRAELTDRIAAAPDDTDLLALRALEAERALDFEAAEQDWRRYAAAVDDATEGQLELADFYGRRARGREEAEALLAAARAPAGPADTLRPPQSQTSWESFERILQVAEDHLLPADFIADVFRAWQTRYPEEPSVYERYLDFLLEEERFGAAETLFADYRAAFSEGAPFAVAGAAELARAREGDAGALTVYEEAFEPSWPPELLERYFALLDEAQRLRRRLDEARALINANPDDLRAAAWLFHYYRSRGDPAAALNELEQFRQSKEARQASWQPQELTTLGALFERASSFDRAARAWYALYSLPEAAPPDRERALTGLVGVLLEAPDQRIPFGSGDLSFYRDAATIDEGPGFLNGFLSLLLNTQGLDWKWQEQERISNAYYHRAAAAELLARLDREFPESDRRPELRARLIDAFGLYGADEGVIREGRRFLEEFPESERRTEVALRIAEAHARQGDTAAEFELYEELLAELGQRAGGVPLGEPASPSFRPGRQGRFGPRGAERLPDPARSPEYARILDRYVSRLAAENRLGDALDLYARQIERYPDDPGLYERLAGFLEANGLTDRIEQTYRRAIEQFPDGSWHHRLARWYLRRQRTAEFGQLTREIVESFAGTDLEQYFREVVGPQIGPQLYLQLNRYAHERFPHDLAFVRNLLQAYETDGTRDAAAWERLIRRHWFYDDDLRRRFFEFLTRNGRLASELAAVRQAAGENQPAARLFVAEAEAWSCHFEQAAPPLRELVEARPVDEPSAGRAASLHRSLAHEDPQALETAVEIRQNLSEFRPEDREALALIGDTLADQGLVDRAAPYWEEMAEREPGQPAAYLDSATVFWDYFHFEQALAQLAEGRRALGRPALYAYEAGAIEESRGRLDAAIAEYLKGALAEEVDDRARRRLLTLSVRPATRQTIDQATEALVLAESPRPAAIRLRTAVLDQQDRRDDLASFLSRFAAGTESFELLDEIDRLAFARNLEDVRVEVLERRIALTSDPIDRIQQRLALMRLHEAQGDREAAERISAALYEEHSRVLGVVRARVDFLSRQERPADAVETLLAAAGTAYPELGRELRFEAAQKATAAGMYDRAREALEVLMEQQPLEPRYVAAAAETYARQGRDQELWEFYQAKLEALSDIEAPEARTRELRTQLRLGLIPALDRIGQPQEALEQYLELLRQNPADEGLVVEATRYAADHALAGRLLGFYEDAVEQSPRDVRFWRGLARAQATLGRWEEALAAYSGALEIRPDSRELWQARAAAEERLLRFDAALESYGKLYELSYEDPRWMLAVAENHVRLGDAAAAAEAVERAEVEGRPERPQSWFNAASLLADWNLVDQAAEAAGRGIELAGDRLMTDAAQRNGLALWVRLETILRRQEAALERLAGLRQGRPAEQTSYLWQEALAAAIGAARDYFSPEELTSFAATLDRFKAQAPREEFWQTLAPAIERAGWPELEARWLGEELRAAPAAPEADNAWRRLERLEERRLEHAELGRRLEDYWLAHPAQNQQLYLLEQAADAYQTAGEWEDEFRARDLAASRGQTSERYFELLVERRPELLPTLASGDRRGLAEQAANYAVFTGGADLAARAVEAFGRSLTPVWRRAYLGLVGLFYADPAERYREAMLAALGPRTVGEQLRSTVDREQALVGDLWFYYGRHYGKLLAATGQPDAADYLPAGLEQRPGAASAYAELASFYLDRQAWAQAVEQFRQALSLDPEDPRLQALLARALWGANEQQEATNLYRQALEGWTERADAGRLRAEFWTEVPALLDELRERSLLARLESAASELLGSYIRKNGSYRVEELVRPLLEAASDPQALWARLLDLAETSPDPFGYLVSFAEAPWLAGDFRVEAYTRAVAVAEGRAAQASGQERDWARQQAREWRFRRLEFLLAQERMEGAEEALGADSAFEESLRLERPALWLRALASLGRIDEILRSLEDEPSVDPPLEAFREAAAELRRIGREEAATRLLESFYEMRIARREAAPADYLGLAELRFEQGRAGEAVDLLDRLLRTAEDPFEHSAAVGRALLEHDQAQQAAERLEQRVRAAPWDAEAKLLYAQALAANDDDSRANELWRELAGDPKQLYHARAQAANRLEGSEGPSLGGAELDLLAAAGPPAPAEARQPRYFEARIAAARDLADPTLRKELLHEAIALRPEEAEELRLQLFDAARAAGDDALAVAVAAGLFERSGLEYSLRGDDTLFNERPPQVKAERWTVEQFQSRVPVEPGEEADFAGRLAESLEQLGRLGPAALFYDVAAWLAPENSTWQTEHERLEAQLTARARDAARRPVVRPDLDQPHPVEPRLAEAAP